MAENKTKQTEQSVEQFLSTVADEQKIKDSKQVIALMQKATKEKAKMWGPSIIGFGKYHYKYQSGHEGDMCIIGFSPRKPNLVFYIMRDSEKLEALVGKLGKVKPSKGCLYVKNLSDIDLNVLEQLITESVKLMKVKYK